ITRCSTRAIRRKTRRGSNCSRIKIQWQVTCATNDIEHRTTKEILKGLTSYEFICKVWSAQPEGFKLNPLQQMPGPNI
ncbi:hypothetical protein NKI41_32745, partial [Mesorhizobium sp. M0601]